ncbi:hypothetical protein K440DRAFT_184259 [Wilcoxina mikolae CBS 423.85]|nr:hypothetical protein K440DRAFT_184259 [Wilcoxina mikolae CBS 423.85]
MQVTACFYLFYRFTDHTPSPPHSINRTFRSTEIQQVFTCCRITGNCRDVAPQSYIADSNPRGPPPPPPSVPFRPNSPTHTMKSIRQAQRLLLTRSQQRFKTSVASIPAEGATGMSRSSVAQDTKCSNDTSGREEVSGGGVSLGIYFYSLSECDGASIDQFQSSATKDSSPLTFNKWRSMERDVEEEMVRRAEQSISKQPEYRE